MTQKIAEWYRHHFRTIIQSNPFARLLDSKEDRVNSAPRRPRVVQFYSSLYYKERIKEKFEAEWARVQALPLVEGAKKPALVNVRSRVTKDVWEQEAEDVRDLVIKKVEAHHKKAMAEFEILRKAPKAKKSAEDYHMYVPFTPL